MKTLFIRIVTLALSLVFSAAFAQSGAGNDSRSAQQAAAEKVSFSDTQLQNFAKAYVAIVNLSREYAPKIKAAADMQQVEQLNIEAQSKMVAAVTAAGLSKDKYQQIANQLKSDQTLVEKINQLLQQAQ
jgi:hypothetical protein